METGLVHSKFLGVQRQVRHYGHLYGRITKLHVAGLSQAINFNLYKYIWIRNGSCNKPIIYKGMTYSSHGLTEHTLWVGLGFINT